MKLLIDADYIVYKSCAAAETEIDFGEDLIVVTSNFSDVMKNINRELDKIKKEFFDSTLILFFSHHQNFRKKLYPITRVTATARNHAATNVLSTPCRYSTR